VQPPLRHEPLAGRLGSSHELSCDQQAPWHISRLAQRLPMHPCRQAHSRFALCCARHMAALATITVILLAVVGKVAGARQRPGDEPGESGSLDHHGSLRTWEFVNPRKPRQIASKLATWQQYCCQPFEAFGGGQHVAKTSDRSGFGCCLDRSGSCPDYPGASRHVLQITLRQHLWPSALDLRRLGVGRSLPCDPRRRLLEVAQHPGGVLPH
jgi:hypothetical protein